MVHYLKDINLLICDYLKLSPLEYSTIVSEDVVNGLDEQESMEYFLNFVHTDSINNGVFYFDVRVVSFINGEPKSFEFTDNMLSLLMEKDIKEQQFEMFLYSMLHEFYMKIQNRY